MQEYITKKDIKIDKRMELLQGIVTSYIYYNPDRAEENDWIYDPHEMKNEYLINLSKQIEIYKYPLLMQAIDEIDECSGYTTLFDDFDNNFNFKERKERVQCFKSISNKTFAEELKKLYENQNMEEFFENSKEEYKKMINAVPDNFVVNLDEIRNLYNSSDEEYKIVISITANGGFSITTNNKRPEITYYKGLNYKDGEYFLDINRLILCAYHEYSHHFVNPIVDKYYDKITTKNDLCEEAKNNGLPQCYQNSNSYLYELFVRANENYLSKKYIPEEYYLDNIEWAKEISWYYIEDIISIIENNIDKYNSYEDLFANEMIGYMNNLPDAYYQNHGKQKKITYI